MKELKVRPRSKDIRLRMDELERQRNEDKIRYLVVGINDPKEDHFIYYIDDTRSGSSETHFAGPFNNPEEARAYMKANDLAG